MPWRTALIVPVPEAERLVGALRSAHDSSAAQGVPAHITVLVPFLDPDEVDEAALEAELGRFDPFDFELDRVERWEEGIVWLHPEPSQPFRELTRAVWRRWPDHPPYDGRHADVIPHLTVADDGAPLEVDAPLPIACRAREVVLLERERPGEVWRTRRRFPLGQRVA